MRSISLDDPALAYVGALDLDRTDKGIVPRRLPAWTRPQIPDLFMDLVVQMPAGVRLRFLSDTTEIVLGVQLTVIQSAPNPAVPATFDLLVDGELVQRVSSIEGRTISMGPGGARDITITEGPSTTIRFAGLPAAQKVIEIWLPHAAVVELRDVQIDDGASVVAAAEPERRRWIHHGSSISHCLEAAGPTGTWPAVAARLGAVELTGLGFGGNCMLDPFVARTIRDLPADLISLKLGINLINGDTMRGRAFGPAVNGFLDTIREGHPTTTLLVISPIWCPSVEDHPGPTVRGAEGGFGIVERPEQLREGSLTVRSIRLALELIVVSRRSLGDDNLHYLDGLELFSENDVADLPDSLHPNSEGYERMGQRFAASAFGSDGPFGS